MARGFESKSVADQQEAAQSRARPRNQAEEADANLLLKRRRLELAKTDVRHQLETARAEPHKEMLRRALTAIDKELGGL